MIEGAKGRVTKRLPVTTWRERANALYTGMKVWVIKLLTVCLGAAGAWWAEQTVTTATTGDRWRGGFWGRRYPGDGRNGGKSSVNVRKLGGGVKCGVGDVVEIKTSRSNRIWREVKTIARVEHCYLCSLHPVLFYSATERSLLPFSRLENMMKTPPLSKSSYAELDVLCSGKTHTANIRWSGQCAPTSSIRRDPFSPKRWATKRRVNSKITQRTHTKDTHKGETRIRKK